ncbi:MAG: hypothetical protein QF660_02970 [Anaerolineales bacterium]|jgi:hypothetical protein|nr:hypothetical protein [Anaerolineales bacterium]
MSDLLHDLATLRAMAADFNDFVHSDTVFWQLSDAGPFRKRFPKLTVGGLLFCQHKLVLLQDTLPPENQIKLHQLQAQLEQYLSGWRSNVEQKALREIGGRLHSWKWYLSDCREDPSDCTAEYATEVYARVYIHLLLQLLSKLPAAKHARDQTSAADADLRGVFSHGAFVWESKLSAAFPSEEYWFLYGHPSVT